MADTKTNVRSIAVAVEEIDSWYAFNAEELNVMREKFTDAKIRLNDIEVRKAASNEVFKEEAKPFNEAANDLFPKIKDRGENRRIEAGLVPDYERDTMEYLSLETGEMIYSRRLRPDERQSKLFTLNQASGDK